MEQLDSRSVPRRRRQARVCRGTWQSGRCRRSMSAGKGRAGARRRPRDSTSPTSRRRVSGDRHGVTLRGQTSRSSPGVHRAGWRTIVLLALKGFAAGGRRGALVAARYLAGATASSVAEARWRARSSRRGPTPTRRPKRGEMRAGARLARRSHRCPLSRGNGLLHSQAIRRNGTACRPRALSCGLRRQPRSPRRFESRSTIPSRPCSAGSETTRKTPRCRTTSPGSTASTSTRSDRGNSGRPQPLDLRAALGVRCRSSAEFIPQMAWVNLRRRAITSRGRLQSASAA